MFLGLSREHRPSSTKWDEVLAKDRVGTLPDREGQLARMNVTPRRAW